MKKYSYTRTIRLPWRWSVIVRREAGPGAGAGKIEAWDMAQTAQADTPPAAEAAPEQPEAVDAPEPTALANEGANENAHN